MSDHHHRRRGSPSPLVLRSVTRECFFFLVTEVNHATFPTVHVGGQEVFQKKISHFIYPDFTEFYCTVIIILLL